MSEPIPIHLARPLVYCAGPITLDPFGCVRQADEAWSWLRPLGVIPFLPQLSIVHEIVRHHPYEDWMDYDFDMIRRCDGLLRLRGESPGADREVDLAHRLGIAVFIESDYNDPEDLIEAVRSWSSNWTAEANA